MLSKLNIGDKVLITDKTLGNYYASFRPNRHTPKKFKKIEVLEFKSPPHLCIIKEFLEINGKKYFKIFPNETNKKLEYNIYSVIDGKELISDNTFAENYTWLKHANTFCVYDIRTKKQKELREKIDMNLSDEWLNAFFKYRKELNHMEDLLWKLKKSVKVLKKANGYGYETKILKRAIERINNFNRNYNYYNI